MLFVILFSDFCFLSSFILYCLTFLFSCKFIFLSILPYSYFCFVMLYYVILSYSI